MLECGKESRMRDLPHHCGTVDSYVIIFYVGRLTITVSADEEHTLIKWCNIDTCDSRKVCEPI